MSIVFVHGRDVVETVLALVVHAVEAVLDNHRQLVAIGWVIADTVGNRTGNQVRVAVLVLQAFTV